MHEPPSGRDQRPWSHFDVSAACMLGSVFDKVANRLVATNSEGFTSQEPHLKVDVTIYHSFFVKIPDDITMYYVLFPFFFVETFT